MHTYRIEGVVNRGRVRGTNKRVSGPVVIVVRAFDAQHARERVFGAVSVDVEDMRTDNGGCRVVLGDFRMTSQRITRAAAYADVWRPVVKWAHLRADGTGETVLTSDRRMEQFR